MRISLATALLALGVQFSTANVLEMIVRGYFPAGYANGTTSGPPDLYGYGFGTLERSYYDSAEMIFYGGSELGFVTVSDFKDFPNITVADFGIPLEFTLTDIKVCGNLLFVSTKDDPNPGMLHIYTTVTHNNNGSLIPPTLIQSVEVGVGPDMVIVNKDCTIVATANEGEGDYDDLVGLVNPEGSVSILRGPFNDNSSPPSVSQVSLNKWTDAELMDMGVHMPLSLSAMMYWNSFEGYNFSAAIDAYTPAAVLEPEYLAWGKNESKLYVNLQENNAVVIVDVATNEAESIHSYGLKDWGVYPIDVMEDGDCVVQRIKDLYSLRSADSIATIAVDGVDYIITANEGDDVEYGPYAERVKGGDIFVGTTIGFANMTADPSVHSTTSVTEGASRFFNSECNDTNAETTFCTDGMRFTMGSSMVDYSDPEAPNIYRMVNIGGRGITIFMVTDTGLEQVWDSGSQFEEAGCSSFPWAHNGIQDEEFAPVNGTFYMYSDDDVRETLAAMNDPEEDGCDDGGDGQPGACPLGQTVDDRTTKDGYAAETVVIGEACGHVYAVTVSEKNSVGYSYDISDISNPTLTQVFHLSPESEMYNPGVAYEARVLGEIDSESIQFLSVEESPTGKAAVLFAGAFSGTASLWEFDCAKDGGGGNVTSSAASDYITGLVVGLIIIAVFF